MIKQFFIAFAVMFAYLVVVNDIMDLFQAPADSIFRINTKYGLYLSSVVFAIVVSIGKKKPKKETATE